MTTLDQRPAAAEPAAQPAVGRDRLATHRCLCAMAQNSAGSYLSRCAATVGNPDQPLCDWCTYEHLNDPRRVLSLDLIRGARA